MPSIHHSVHRLLRVLAILSLSVTVLTNCTQIATPTNNHLSASWQHISLSNSDWIDNDTALEAEIIHAIDYLNMELDWQRYHAMRNVVLKALQYQIKSNIRLHPKPSDQELEQAFNQWCQYQSEACLDEYGRTDKANRLAFEQDFIKAYREQTFKDLALTQFKELPLTVDWPLPQLARYNDYLSLNTMPNRHTLGSADAPLKIHLISSFDCELCLPYHIKLYNFVDKLKNKVSLTYHHNPLFNNGLLLSYTSECIAEEGEFWPFFKAFAESYSFEDDNIDEIIQKIDLNPKAIQACTRQEKHHTLVQQQIEVAEKFGAPIIKGPFIVINGYPVKGMPPMDYLESVIRRIEN
ncbi:MAG: DsbA family protein [Cellvibrionaceae bacterium]